MRIYLDHAATTHILPEAREALLSALDPIYTNASSLHENGRKAKALVEKARSNIASQIGALPQEILFNSGGTEGNNHCLHMAVHSLGIKRIISSAIEHKAVLEPAEYLSNTQSIEFKKLPLTPQGFVDYLALENLLNDGIPSLVSLMWVNNELGIINNLDEISRICKKYNALFHTDAVQGIGKLNLDLKNTAVDLLTASAHKFGGPRGTGFLYINKQLKNKEPLIKGGGQERSLRGGTLNVAGIYSMSVALSTYSTMRNEQHAYFEDLCQYFASKLSSIGGVQWNSPVGDTHHYPAIMNLHLLSVKDTSLLLFKLDLAGISLSAGSACNSGSLKPSHVIETLYPDRVHSANLRVSVSYSNKKEEADQLLEKLSEILKYP